MLTTGCGAYLLDTGSADTSGASYASTDDDVSAVCLLNGATLTLDNATITKTGDTSSSDRSSFYGLNAAVLAGQGSRLSMTGGSVTTDGSGTNGVFATGDGTTVHLSGVTIDARGNGAHAVMATLGGTLELSDARLITSDAHSAAVATDRGGGTIDVTGGSVRTSGQDSPGIYSTGTIRVSGATIEATGAESVVIEGANAVTLVDSNVTSSVANKWGVMLYQSFSGDAEGSEGSFTMTGGSLANSAATGPLFFVTNATGTITLHGVEVSAGSGTLVQASATDRWGTSGSNGGHAVLIADAQTLEGNLSADGISTLSVRLEQRSSLTGAINADGEAKAATLTLDASSSWVVTADSHLNTLSGAAIDGDSVTNIVGNGHNVTYDATSAANAPLAGGTYHLVGGGTLHPASSGA